MIIPLKKNRNHWNKKLSFLKKLSFFSIQKKLPVGYLAYFLTESNIEYVKELRIRNRELGIGNFA